MASRWRHRSYQTGNQIGLKTALSLMGCQDIQQRDTGAHNLSYATGTDQIVASDIPTRLEPADINCEPHLSVDPLSPSEGPNQYEVEKVAQSYGQLVTSIIYPPAIRTDLCTKHYSHSK